MIEVGDKIIINYMKNEPDYLGREGIVTRIDSMGASSWNLGWIGSYSK